MHEPDDENRSAMFDLKTSLNSLGLAMTIAGVALIYFNSPINYSGIDGNANPNEVDTRTNRRNRLMSAGTALVVLGTLAQLVSNYVPPG